MEKDKSPSQAAHFYHQAMAAVFEISICHEDRRYAQQAAQEAFDELDRFEGLFSRFVPESDISRINKLDPGQSAHIDPDLYECLRLCAKIHTETNGAFDITAGSDAAGRQLHLDSNQFTVRRPDEKVIIDLGGIGKGCAIDKTAALLRQWDIEIALINAGSSTLLALEPPAEKKHWSIRLTNPADRSGILARIHLTNRSISCSSVQHRPHIIDPRTARPIEDKIAAWASAPNAAAADALSTAFMVMSPQHVEQYCITHPGISAMILTKPNEAGTQRILRFGPWKELLI